MKHVSILLEGCFSDMCILYYCMDKSYQPHCNVAVDEG